LRQDNEFSQQSPFGRKNPMRTIYSFLLIQQIKTSKSIKNKRRLFSREAKYAHMCLDPGKAAECVKLARLSAMRFDRYYS